MYWFAVYCLPSMLKMLATGKIKKLNQHQDRLNQYEIFKTNGAVPVLCSLDIFVMSPLYRM